MPYAVNGKISKKPLDGCIEITDEQYKKAMQAQLAGHQIVVRREGLRILSQENKTQQRNGAQQVSVEQNFRARHSVYNRRNEGLIGHNILAQ